MADNKSAQNRVLTIRVSATTLSFAMPGDDDTIAYEPYVVRSGISMAANLREAFKEAELLLDPPQRVRLSIDSPVVLVPTEHFLESEATMLYSHAMKLKEADTVGFNVLPDLNTIALFPINKDLKLVIDDHFRQASIVCSMATLWRSLHQRNFQSRRNKLYAYFREGLLSVFCFTQHRFKFCNTFEVANIHDALFFILYVWKQVAFDKDHDEIHIMGEMPEGEEMLAELRKYVPKSYVLSASALFNRAPSTLVKGMPFDLMTTLV